MSHTAYLIDQETLQEADEFKRQMIEPKRWRIYYNRRDDWPFLVAVDNGTIATQTRLQRFECYTPTSGATDLGPPKPRVERFNSLQEMTEAQLLQAQRESRKGRQNEPTWWIETFAIAEFKDGGVIFHDPRR